MYAGTSALLLSVAGLWPELRPLALVALTPFLFCVWRATPHHALRVGVFFGLAHFIASAFGPQHDASLVTLMRYVAAMGSLGALGWIIAAARRLWGLNPVFTAALWFIADSVVAGLGIPGGVLGTISLGGGHLSGVAMVCGFLTVSFLIILCNAVLLLAWCVLTQPCDGTNRRAVRAPKRRRTIDWDTPSLPSLTVTLPQDRAPPVALV